MIRQSSSKPLADFASEYARSSGSRTKACGSGISACLDPLGHSRRRPTHSGSLQVRQQDETTVGISERSPGATERPTIGYLSGQTQTAPSTPFAAPTTILSGPTPIPVLEIPAAIDAVEPETKRPAPATVATTKPASATQLTSLGRPLRATSPEHGRSAKERMTRVVPLANPREARSLKRSPKRRRSSDVLPSSGESSGHLPPLGCRWSAGVCADSGQDVGAS